MVEVQLRAIGKSFPGVQALTDVTLAATPGSVHVVAGENGAGKSTLMKVLAGIYQPDNGQVELDGESVVFHRPADARARGIVMIPQELSLVPDMTVADNIYVGAEPRRGALIDHAKMRRMAAEQLSRLNADIEPTATVRTLSVARMQLVEIARALASDADVLIMDEPTAALGNEDAQRLLETILDLKNQGKTIFYISHRLPEIMAIADQVWVLRDGALVARFAADELSEDRLISAMAGTSARVAAAVAEHREPGPVLLEVRALSGSAFHDIGLEVRQGEVVGLAGLVGAGRTELALAILGVQPSASGQVLVDGKPQRIRSPREAIRAGIAYVPEDRKGAGLVLDGFSIRENTTIPLLDRLKRRGLVRRGIESATAKELVDTVGTVYRDVEQPVATLSGGNQQKVVLARWLGVRPRVLILDEPTRGIDINAKREIYALVARLAAEGMGVLLISSEIEELLEHSDRMLVMREGRLAGRLERNNYTREAVLRLALPEHHGKGAEQL